MTARANSAMHAGEFAHEYTSFVAEIDLLTDGDGPANSSCAREVIVTAAGGGTLALTLKGGATFSTANAYVGLRLALQVQAIETTTDVGGLIVIW